MAKNYQIGDVVVFAMQKRGPSPGPRAKIVHTDEKGDNYSYLVDKFWRIVKADKQQLVLKTRRGKTHVVSADDNRLRKPNLWEFLFMRSRFPRPNGTEGESRQSVDAA